MALTDLTDREAMAVMLGCTADDVRRSREMKKEKMGVPVRSVTDFTVTSGEQDDSRIFWNGVCAWCGSSGLHKSGCKALYAAQTEKYVRLSTENYIKGTATVTIPPEQEKDVRTEMQRRFDAIAEEVLYGGSLPVRGDKPKS